MRRELTKLEIKQEDVRNCRGHIAYVKAMLEPGRIEKERATLTAARDKAQKDLDNFEASVLTWPTELVILEKRLEELSAKLPKKVLGDPNDQPTEGDVEQREALHEFLQAAIKDKRKPLTNAQSQLFMQTLKDIQKLRRGK